MRKPVVTRTINSTLVHALCMDIAEGRAYETDITVPGIMKDEKKILRALSTHVPEGHKAVTVKGFEHVKTLYGMDEGVFIQHAHVLPPRGTKHNQDQEENK